MLKCLSSGVQKKGSPEKNTIPHVSKDLNWRQLKSIFSPDKLVIFVVLVVNCFQHVGCITFSTLSFFSKGSGKVIKKKRKRKGKRERERERGREEEEEEDKEKETEKERERTSLLWKKNASIVLTVAFGIFL